MNRVSLTMPATTAGHARRRTAAVAATLAGAGAGAVLALWLMVLWPLALSLAAVLAFGWLMQTQPLVPHVEYFSADEDGLRYVHADGRVARYQWTEILSVSAAKGGLALETGRGAQKGATLMLAMRSEADCRAAANAAAHWLAAYRV
ncbi:hypothetical protein [Duganella sp. P38]|jgi:hypothetical protein|uniref:hypothetical protein n=1 Tax=Duganella sp. P38 TaxID=3423949 RepID=UPI003D79FE68